VKPTRFLIPAYSRLELAKFRIGLRLYDWLAGGSIHKPSEQVSPYEIAGRFPTLIQRRLRGGVEFDDAVFDDARLLIDILKRARELGAMTLNYAEVVDIRRSSHPQSPATVIVQDHVGRRELQIACRAIINASGPLSDAVRRLEDETAGPSLSTSQGSHIVVAGRFIGGSNEAIVFPKTPDKRIMFAIPWHGHTLLGTTEAATDPSLDVPQPTDAEIDEILEVAGNFLEPSPSRSDILSVFAGIRPLKRRPMRTSTARLSREHALDVNTDGMITVSGGKWTTYRLIAEQTVDLAVQTGNLAPASSQTTELSISPEVPSAEARFSDWGSSAGELDKLVEVDVELGRDLHPDLPYCGAHFVWAARNELAVTVFDALAYRTRAMFLNAEAARSIAPRVASLMARELGRDKEWIRQQIEDVNRMAPIHMVNSTSTRSA
jgi:glycerol-3-phosphate dehydrogenase